MASPDSFSRTPMKTPAAARAALSARVPEPPVPPMTRGARSVRVLSIRIAAPYRNPSGSPGGPATIGWAAVLARASSAPSAQVPADDVLEPVDVLREMLPIQARGKLLLQG